MPPPPPPPLWSESEVPYFASNRFLFSPWINNLISNDFFFTLVSSPSIGAWFIASQSRTWTLQRTTFGVGIMPQRCAGRKNYSWRRIWLRLMLRWSLKKKFKKNMKISLVQEISSIVISYSGLTIDFIQYMGREWWCKHYRCFRHISC